jgi:hypothetical protein
MSATTEAARPQDAALQQALHTPYPHGFTTDIESDSLPPGLDEDTIRAISRKKREPAFLLQWRLAAFERWRSMAPPDWAQLRMEPVDFQALSYYSAPKSLKNAPKSLDEVDPQLLETYEKLGVPLHERARLAGVAVDAVFDSVSVGTTFREQLAAVGVIFCSFSHAVQHHPELIERYLGSVVPHGRQLLRRAQLGGVLRWLLCLHPQGREVPDGAVVVLSHQRAQHRAVRAHAHHCRAGQRGQLPGRLHRPAARRAPAARGRGGAGGA